MKSAADKELTEAAEFLSKKTGETVEFCRAFLQEDPFEGYDEMVAKELKKQEKPKYARMAHAA
jgi:hypothetical protein